MGMTDMESTAGSLLGWANAVLPAQCAFEHMKQCMLLALVVTQSAIPEQWLLPLFGRIRAKCLLMDSKGPGVGAIPTGWPHTT
jgi:hypothetical protein